MGQSLPVHACDVCKTAYLIGPGDADRCRRCHAPLRALSKADATRFIQQLRREDDYEGPAVPTQPSVSP